MNTLNSAKFIEENNKTYFATFTYTNSIKLYFQLKLQQITEILICFKGKKPWYLWKKRVK